MNILAVDIGGTNSRFARFTFSGARMILHESVWLPTNGADSFAGILENLAATDFPLAPAQADVAVIGVPGAVRGNVYCDPPNTPWDIDLRKTPLSPGRTTMINDFVAQAYATRTDAVAHSQVVQEGQAEEGRPIAVIGAGTGLGHCALLPVYSGWAAVPSEAGHQAFALVSPEEREFEAFVLARTGEPYCQVESVVTGSGLALVHEFLTGNVLSPRQVGQTLRQGSETLAWFARFYGRAARNYALAVVAIGGMFVAGGVAAKNPLLVTAPQFCEEFCNQSHFGVMLANIPIKLNANEDSGLYGAAYYGWQLLEYS